MYQAIGIKYTRAPLPRLCINVDTLLEWFLGFILYFILTLSSSPSGIYIRTAAPRGMFI